MRFSITIMFLGLFIVASQAQEIISPLVPPNALETSLENIMNHLSTVTLEKVRYEQRLSYSEERPYLLDLEVKEFKGKKVISTTYRFNLANIDQDQVEYAQKKTHYEIKLSCTDKQKFILPEKDGKQEAYANAVTFYGVDAENAQSLQSAFRMSIPKAKEQVVETVQLSDLDDGMAWLAEHTSNVKVGKKFFQQTFDRSEDISTQLTFELDDETTTFNLIDLNPNTIAIDVQGKNLLVVGQTDDKVDFITNKKKRELKAYSNKFGVMVETVEEGKLMVDVIQQMIPWAREAFREYVPVVNDRMEGLALLKEYIGTAPDGGNEVGQAIEASCITALSQSRSTKKGTSNTLVKFNLDDLDSKHLDVSISGKTITVDLEVKDKQLLFQSFVDDEFEKYANKHSIYAANVENARYLQQLIPKVIGKCKSDLAMKAPLDSQADFQWISSETKDIQTPTAVYKQVLTQSETNTCEWTLAQTIEKPKKSITHEYTFSLKDLDPEKVDFSINSKELAIEFAAVKRQKAIQHSQDDGKGSPAVNNFLLLMDDVETARQMKKILKQAVSACQ